uniref:helix-turn-helix domain-containing protein n=1 Tax=Castellaniella defragrans TaxID=75697 RepID=UPI0033418E0C
MNQAPSQIDMLMRESAPEGALHGIGETLKRMREAKGLSLPEVSARIKYSALQLGYLEAQEWTRLPEGVPLRGLVRNYARFLGADVDVMLRLLEGEVGSARPSPVAAMPGGAQTSRVVNIPLRSEPARRTWIWLLLILVLLCVAGLLYVVNRGSAPGEWLFFDWFKAPKS